MPSASTEHMGTKIANCVVQCMDVANQDALTLPESERSNFYRRLAHYVNGQIIGYHSSYQLTSESDRDTSNRVSRTSERIYKAGLSQFRSRTEEQMLFYKLIHRAFCRQADALDGLPIDGEDIVFPSRDLF